MPNDIKNRVASGQMLTVGGLLHSSIEDRPQRRHEVPVASFLLKRYGRLIWSLCTASRRAMEVVSLLRCRQDVVRHFDAVHFRRSTDDVLRFRYSIVGTQPRDRLWKDPANVRAQVANRFCKLLVV